MFGPFRAPLDYGECLELYLIYPKKKREERIGFAAKRTTLKLSQKTVGGAGQEICNSLRRELSQESSASVAAMILNSTSALDLLTTCCFLLDQEIRLDPREIQKLDVDFLSSTLDPQLESQNANNLKFEHL